MMSVGSGHPAWSLILLHLALILKLHYVLASTSGPPPLLLSRFDVPEHCTLEHESALTCVYRLRKPSTIEHTNFSRIASDYVTTIHIVCDNDEEDWQSSMANSSIIIKYFVHLWRLRDFRLTGCKFTFWPSTILNGFRDLRNFQFHSLHKRKSDISLEFEYGAFTMTPLIEKMDLSFNNIWQLPKNIFCPLTNLVTLNISWNILSDIGELGFSDHIITSVIKKEITSTQHSAHLECSLDIQSLDISNNELSVLPAYGLSSLKRLRTLNMTGNIISMVDDSALRGLRSLESCDLSSNRIVALPAGMFNDATNTLKELRLENNSISALAPGLVADMNQLVTLDLSRNTLTSMWLNSATFTGLIRLVLLDLSRNKIVKLDPTLFKDLYTLQILNLQYNEIETIAGDTFSPMSNLHTLELAHNKLKYLDAYSLNGLYAVSLLSLDSNALQGIHPDAFKNCSSMQDLNLSNNNLETIPVALNDMRMLKTLDLGENQIRSLENPGFHGMSNLYGLRMIGNDIVNVTKASLSELPTLQILNLARNKIEYVEYAAFTNNPSLQAIRLDANYIIDMSGIFASTPGLLWLNMSDNMISHFDYTLLPKKLQWMDLHKNMIMDLGIAPQNFHLQTLDISFNRLTRIHAKSIPDSIELLFINDNIIHSIEPQTFYDKENLTRVDLYANQIVKIDLSAFQLRGVPDNRPLPEFYIGGNPFICDCTTEWLQRINFLSMRQNPRVMDLDSVYCRLPYDRFRAFVPLLDAKPSQFLCTYKAHCFALCHCCDFDACDCEMTCPNSCTCYHDQLWSANVVDCSNAEYKSLPARLPMDATEVYLDGNNFGELTSHSFIGRKNLQVLYANASNIIAIHNHTFSGLKRLIILHLENNKITRLNGGELAPMKNLKELYLQNNLIMFIGNTTFYNLDSLEILWLDNNQLSTFSLWQLSYNSYLADIKISNNPWSCDCIYLNRVRDWIFKNTDKIKDWKRLTCSMGKVITLPTINCATRTATTLGIETSPLEAYLALMLTIVLVLVVVIALFWGVFKYRRRIRAWIASYCGLRVCYKTAAFEDREKPFDAYISYSAADENFVSRVLVPGLETSYRLCLHYRDLGTGVNVADAVTEAADSSRRIILILSHNFLHGEWARFEFKAALRDALRGKGRTVILLLVGGICSSDLDADIRKSIPSHTILVWGDKLFWQKLQFAMPDVLPIPVFERPLPPPPAPPSSSQQLWP